MRLGSQMLIIFLFLSLTMDYGLWTMDSFAQPVSSTELIEKAKEYDNKEVEYQGEAVGDVMARGEFAWVNLNDGVTAIGIWGKKDLITEVVNCKGNYNCKGDILQVKGVFHRACPQHGGDLDIHMYEIAKLKEGFLISHPVNFSKVAKAFSLAIVALALSVLCALKAKKR